MIKLLKNKILWFLTVTGIVVVGYAAEISTVPLTEVEKVDQMQAALFEKYGEYVQIKEDKTFLKKDGEVSEKNYKRDLPPNTRVETYSSSEGSGYHIIEWRDVSTQVFNATTSETETKIVREEKLTSFGVENKTHDWKI